MRRTRRGKRAAPGHKGKGSDRQPRPALGTTGIDDTTAILGGHTGTKTMGTVTLQFAGLKSSFHGSLLLNVFSNKKSRLSRREKGAKSTVSRDSVSR